MVRQLGAGHNRIAACCIALVDLSGTLGLSTFSMRSGCVTCCKSGLPPSSSEESHCVTLPHCQCCSACSSVIRAARLLQHAGAHAQGAHARVLLSRASAAAPFWHLCNVAVQGRARLRLWLSPAKVDLCTQTAASRMTYGRASGQCAHCCLKCFLDHCSGQLSLPHGKSADDQRVRSLAKGLVQDRQLSVVSSVRLTQALSRSCRGKQHCKAPQRLQCSNGSCL